VFRLFAYDLDSDLDLDLVLHPDLDPIRQITRRSRGTSTFTYFVVILQRWLGSRVVSVLDSGAEGPGFKSQPRRCRVTVLGKLFTPIVRLFTKQQNW